jgi:hypothetical protein
MMAAADGENYQAFKSLAEARTHPDAAMIMEAAGITSTPTTPCFLPGDGHTFSMLLNRAFALPGFKKAATPATFPSLACCIEVPAIFSHGHDMAMCRSESKRQRLSMGVAAVPSDQWPTGIMNSVIGSGAP